MKERKKELIKFITTNGLPKNLGLTWFEVANKFGIGIELQPKSAARKAQRIWQGYFNKSDILKKKVLIFDIETSYNIIKAWRVGYNVSSNYKDIIKERAIICISYKWLGTDKVNTLYWKNGDDKKLVKDFIKILNEADEVVGHNIDKFDIKWLRTRALFHGIPMRFSYPTTDTYKIAKKYFYLNSNSLDYIARVLKIESKIQHEGMVMWDEVIMNNNMEYLLKMGEYCEQDVRVSENVFNILNSYSEKKIHHGVLGGKSKTSCPECGHEGHSLLKTSATKAGTKKVLVECGNCFTEFNISFTSYKNSIKDDSVQQKRTKNTK